jgi:hypothetical protein
MVEKTGKSEEYQIEMKQMVRNGREDIENEWISKMRLNKWFEMAKMTGEIWWTSKIKWN